MFGSLLTLLSAGIIGLVGYVWVGNYLRTGGGGGSGSGSGGDSGGSTTATATGPKTPGTLSGKPSRAQVAAGAKTSAVPPPLPKRTEAQTAQMAKEQSARDAAAAKAAAEAAKAASEKAAKELKEANARDKEAAKAAAAQAAAAAKEAAAKEAAAAKLAQQREKEAKEAAAAAEKERIAAEKAAAAAEKERIAAEKAAAAAEKERLAAEAKRAAQAEADRAQAERERVQAERERHLREKEREAAEKDAADKKAAKAASLLSLAMASPPALPKRPMLNILHAPTLTESVAFSPSPRDSSASASAEPSSARSCDSDAASKAAKAEDHRRQVLWEMVASEEKYISSLNALMEVFFRPLKVKADKGSDKISPAEFSLLFSNVEAIWQFHKMMLPALKTSPDGNVAAVLQAHADYLKMVLHQSVMRVQRMRRVAPWREPLTRLFLIALRLSPSLHCQYTKYVADYTPALQTVNKLYKREGFMRMIKKQRELPAAEGLDLMRSHGHKGGQRQRRRQLQSDSRGSISAIDRRAPLLCRLLALTAH